MSEPAHPIGAALGRRFSHVSKRAAFASSSAAQNQRRNLNLDLIALMERGHRSDSAEVMAIRHRLAQLTETAA